MSPPPIVTTSSISPPSSVLSPPLSVSCSSFSSNNNNNKPLDVVSLPSLKIKEFKNNVKERDYGGNSSRSGGQDIAVSIPGVADAPLQLVPPLKIKSSPVDDKTGGYSYNYLYYDTLLYYRCF